MNEFQHPLFKTYLDYYFAIGQYVDPTAVNFGKVTPQKPYPGMLVYANGVEWDPGSGEGYYRYTAATATWVFVG